MSIKPMEWSGGHLCMLDQRLLPAQEVWLELNTWQEVRDAIRDMAVRGAPAIGIAAAYGMALAAKEGAIQEEASKGLAGSRPTAVNLFWALERINNLGTWDFEKILAEAKMIELEDLQCNLGIGHNGNMLLGDKVNILTICNTGSLATAGHGTALGTIRTAFYEGKELFVYTCETRPRLQGLRLTAWELLKEGIPFQSIADSAAASLMRAGKVDCVIAGADRIAANGDSANKIGTYSLAVLAKHHGIPFYIAAPSTTLDPSIPSGDLIPIEERASEEVTHIEGVAIAPDGCTVYNPAFDVTPGDLITAIITEEGVFGSPYAFVKELAER
ncbi:MAG TPA: S-methyl-5-thioribose-1-phosphate isomerase [Fimbriimonadaceae bacterium]